MDYFVIRPINRGQPSPVRAAGRGEQIYGGCRADGAPGGGDGRRVGGGEGGPLGELLEPLFLRRSTRFRSSSDVPTRGAAAVPNDGRYLKSLEPGLLLFQGRLLLPLVHLGEGHPRAGERRDGVGQSAGPAGRRDILTQLRWRDPHEEERGPVGRRRLAHLLAAVESLTFLPSKEAKCCSRASRRLLGACGDGKKTQSQQLPET